MHGRHEVTDSQWKRVAPVLPGQAGAPGVTADNRLFINAVFFGSLARVLRGAICRGGSGSGTASSNASIAGRSKESGNTSCTLSAKTPTWNGC